MRCAACAQTHSSESECSTVCCRLEGRVPVLLPSLELHYLFKGSFLIWEVAIITVTVGKGSED